jgi:hypothetical protein
MHFAHDPFSINLRQVEADVRVNRIERDEGVEKKPFAAAAEAMAQSLFTAGGGTSPRRGNLSRYVTAFNTEDRGKALSMRFLTKWPKNMHHWASRC